MLLGSPYYEEAVPLNRRKQYDLEYPECSSKTSPKCSGVTVRVRGRSRHKAAVCSYCSSFNNYMRRLERKATVSPLGNLQDIWRTLLTWAVAITSPTPLATEHMRLFVHGGTIDASTYFSNPLGRWCGQFQ